MMMPVPVASCGDAPELPQQDVFEGPEKKLEVFFSIPSSPRGFREFGEPVWSDLLVEAACSILHRKSNAHFDAYLLSESSLFVYANKVILKTCGTTRLLLVLPKLLAIAKKIEATVDHVHYAHYRYKFPEQQLFPHSSFDQERAYLTHHFGTVHSRVLGDPDGRCWYALCTQQEMLAHGPPPSSPNGGDDLFEIAMEGLSKDVSEQFHFSSFPDLKGKELAAHMTSISGIGALLPGVEVDDWAFEPCGYSMNGLRGQYYYTIHITPEDGFSYASFETNDPQYRQPKWVQAVIATFSPSVMTVTLTTRTDGLALPPYPLADFERNCSDTASLGAGVSVSCTNYSLRGADWKRDLEAVKQAQEEETQSVVSSVAQVLPSGAVRVAVA